MGSPSTVEGAAAVVPAQGYFSASEEAAGLLAFGPRCSEQRHQAESYLVARCVASTESSVNFLASAVRFAKNGISFMNISETAVELT